MNKSKKIAIGASISIIIIALSGPFVTIGMPSVTSECGFSGCHGTHVMTISSNATGIVNTVVGGHFSLIVDAESHAITPAAGDMAVVIRNGWADNNQFSFIEEVILDNGDGDSNATLGVITTTFSFTSQAIGNWTLRIWTAGQVAISQSLDVPVLVTADDTPPSIDHPSDMSIAEGDASKNITWNPLDEAPTGYEIFDDGVSWVIEYYWDGSPIVLTLNNLTLGTHNITIIVWDASDNTISDQVYVTVFDGSAPTIDSPLVPDIIEGTTGNIITWHPSDLHPLSYEIFRNGTLVKSGQWNTSSETISISLDGLTPGTYNYSIRVTDIGYNHATDHVYVVVLPPTSQLSLEIILTSFLLGVGTCVVIIVVIKTFGGKK